MPKYSFKCDACERVVKRYVKSTVLEAECECGAVMRRLLPNLNGASEVTETVNPTTGMRWKQDQQEMIKERRDDYFWKVEVPRLVNSGTYSMETILERGWIYFDDARRMHIYTKPPQKR
jgi:hypothetical protein